MMEGRVRSGDRERSVTELQRRGERVARGLQALGARDGARVATVLRNDIAFFELIAGARLAGAWIVPINWHFSADEVGFILRDSQARVIVIHADLLAKMRDAIPPGVAIIVVPTPPELAAAYRVEEAACAAPPDSLCWDDWIDTNEPIDAPASPPGANMLYTSGTTGRPKGVLRKPLDDDALERYCQAISFAFGIDPGMRAVMTGPLYHSAPYGYATMGLRQHCDLLLMPRFEAHALLELIERERLTHMHLVPTMLVRLLRLPEEIKKRYDLSSLRCVVHGAAPCPEDVKRAMIEWWGPVLREYYGSTEASLVAAVGSEEWLARPGTVGRPIPGAYFEIQDDDGRRLAPGEIGEIWLRLQGAPEFDYHGHPEARAEMERDGLLTNGDLGYVDADGYLYLCDRKKDMIISGGVNIYPAEIEAVLITHSAVRDCAVFGIPDAEFGERVAAAIETVNGEPIEGVQIETFLAERLARFKIPQVLTFHPVLPRQDNGKIYKQSLRAPYWSATGRKI